MKWLKRKKTHEPSEEIRQARAETLEAKKRLQSVKRDDEDLHKITVRMQRIARENNFAADIRRALGGTK